MDHHQPTWEGHEFIDAARDDSRWKKATEKVGSAAGSVPLKVLTDVLVSLAKSQLGM